MKIWSARSYEEIWTEESDKRKSGFVAGAVRLAVSVPTVSELPCADGLVGSAWCASTGA